MTRFLHVQVGVAPLLCLLLLSGCDSWFGDTKEPLAGNRVAVMALPRALAVDPAVQRTVTLPSPAPNANWPQPGGGPAHDGEHPAAGETLTRAWRASIGDGGGYRAKITAQPVVLGGTVFTMDSDANVSAFSTEDGGRRWRTYTQDEDDRSTNVGGGITVNGNAVYAATGRGELLALNAENGEILWRKKLVSSARAAPTFADDKLFVPTLDGQLLAFSAKDGSQLWNFQSAFSTTSVLGLPAPAFYDGLVVAGFSSGDLVALRAASGAVAWADSLAAARGRTSLVDFSTVRGMPVIRDGRVYAISLGQLLLAIDLRTGRRLWEREVASSESPWVAGDFLFVVSADAVVAALDRSDGAVAWATQLDQYENMEKRRSPIRWVGPVLVGDRLVVAGSDGRALALSPYTGKVIGQQDLVGPIAVSPVVAGGTLYVITDDGSLTAYR